MTDKLISLCMIVGNVEEYIERCLESFSPIADEIVLVRAIGSNQPDKTIDIAKRRFPRRLIIGEYKNKPGHEDWPHIDDFAAARQLSFDMASGEYLFWCDSDDVLKEGSAEIARELARRGGYPCFIFPYQIFARGVTVPRERMVARGAGKWVFPVHECFEYHIQPVKSVEDNRVVVIHMPHFTGKNAKTGSTDRNLRILKSIPEKEMTPGLLYHLHGEYLASNETDKAVEVAKVALQSSELGRPERYEIMLNLGRASKDPKDIEAYLHQAYKVDPRRREALALLACNAMDYCENDIALAYARQMMATPMPTPPAWNSREAIYGWLGADFFSQALRVNGYHVEAEKVRHKSFEVVEGPRISLLHATRGRPFQASMARKLWLDLAERPDRVEHIFCIDGDDKDSTPLARMHHVVCQEGGGCVLAWNMGAFISTAKVVVQMSDDWIPMPCWDKLILERLGDVRRPAVLAISDGHRTDRLITMAIATEKYWKEDCFLFHPWFTGVYSDNWFTDLAYSRGAVIEARDLVFEHQHPAFGTAKLDQTYLNQNHPDRYKEGERLYNIIKERKDWSSVPGWFDYWQFYRNMAALISDGSQIAEVGVWMGRSIIFLAQELQAQNKKVKIYAVDSFKGEDGQQEHSDAIASAGGNLRSVFEDNIKRCGVDHMIEIIEGDSAESAARIADGSLSFCFIDAAHDYESVKRDIAAWKPKMNCKGILAGHDAKWGDVAKAVSESIESPKIMGSVWADIKTLSSQ